MRAPTPARPRRFERPAFAPHAVGLLCAAVLAVSSLVPLKSARAAPVIVEALLSISGPEASAATRLVVRRGDEEIAVAEGPRLEIDLEPGPYVIEAVSGLSTQRTRVRVRPDGEQRVRVNLRAGILAVRSRSGVRMILTAPEPDVFGDQPVLAETEGGDWALTLPQGRYRLRVEGIEGRVILDQDVEIVPARREIITTR